MSEYKKIKHFQYLWEKITMWSLFSKNCIFLTDVGLCREGWGGTILGETSRG